MSRELLKEAIADAKAVKEAAIANAKAALEEAFTPHLKELLASKLESLEESEDMEEMKMKRQMEEMDEMDEMMHGKNKGLEELDLEEILAELEGSLEEEDEMMNEAKEKDESEEEAEEGESEEESKGSKKGSDKPVGKMTPDQFEKLIMDVFKEMAASGEFDSMKGEEPMGDKAMAGMGGEEEIDLAELMLEIQKEKEMNEYVEGGPSSENALLKAVDAAIKKGGELAKKLLKLLASGGGGWQRGGMYEEYLREYVEGGPSSENALLKAVDAALEKGGELAKKLLKLLASGGGGWQRGGMYEEDLNEYVEGGPSSENALLKAVDAAIAKGGELAKKLMALLAQGGGGWQRGGMYEDELNEAYSTIKTLRSDLNEVNLLNAKLLYTNKVFKARNLTESQKVKVLSTFDKATTVKEVKLVFESLSTSIAASNNTVKAPIKESMGFASKASGVVKNSQTIETDAVIARMKKLAGL